MLIIARLFPAALYQASSARAWRASQNQKVAAKSPWEKKGVRGGKAEGACPCSGVSEQREGRLEGSPARVKRCPRTPEATLIGDQLTRAEGGGCPSQHHGKLRLLGSLPPACPCGCSLPALARERLRGALLAPHRSPRSAGCPRPPSARPGGRAGS